MGQHALFTIGYEGAVLADFWATLLTSGVRTVIDVRDVPFSRKPGFSKKALSDGADARDLRYVHLRGLGDPKEGREAAKAGKHALFLEIFSAHLAGPAALIDLATAIDLSLAAPSCLLCYERDPKQCHRSIVASRMIDREGFSLVHLGVAAGLALKPRPIEGYHGAPALAFG